MFKTIRDWSSEFTTPFAEALKEAFRVTLFSVPGQLILWLENKDIIVKVLIINIVLIFLRALDKFLHEKDKKGLSPI